MMSPREATVPAPLTTCAQQDLAMMARRDLGRQTGQVLSKNETTQVPIIASKGAISNRTKMEVIMRRASLLILLLLCALSVVASVSIPGNNRVQSQSKPVYTSMLTSRQSIASSAHVYLYFVLKEPAGFLLARASEGDAH